MFTINVDTQKLTDAEKILALGEPENLAKMDFALVDAAGQPVNAENCQFDLMIGDVSCPRYKTDGNTVSFRYVALDITKAETDFTLTMQKDGAAILNDTIKVTAEVQGDIVLPDVTVTADTMLKDVTAINTAGEVVTGNISDAVVTTDETNGLTVNVSKGYVAADETRAFDPSVVTETENQVTISRGWLNEDKAFQVGGSSEVQGFVYDNAPQIATTLQIIPETLTADITNFSNMFQNCSALTSVSALDTSNGTNFYQMFYNCYLLTSVPALDTSNGTNFSLMFAFCQKLTSVPALDTSNGTSFQGMFSNCYLLTSVPALDTSKGTNFYYMFAYCSKLTTIEGIDFSGATSTIANDIFYGCSALTSLTVNGTIAQNIDFSQAPNLDAASCISIAQALVENTSTLTITFKSTTYDNILLETTMPGTSYNIKGYIVSKKGWAIKTV